jgi:sigma-B regulation protein RsbU (phosphoserine phosphatase)
VADPSQAPPASETAGPHRSSGLTYRVQLLLTMCGLVLLVGVVILGVADWNNRTGTRALANSLFREVSAHVVTQTRDFISRAAPIAQSLEQMANQGLALDDLDRLGPQLLAFLKGNPGMTRVLYGDESGEHVGASRRNDGSLHIERTRRVGGGGGPGRPGTPGGRALSSEYEVLPDGSTGPVRTDEEREYDPRTRPFYDLAKRSRAVAWTPPYMFFSEGVPGISCVVPVYGPPGAGGVGELRGVFSVEFDLRALSKFVAGQSVSENSRVFMFTREGTLLAHPNQITARSTGVNGKGTLLTIADTGDPLVDAFRASGGVGADAGGADGFRFFEFGDGGAEYLASTTTFSVGDGQSWVVGTIAPKADFFAGVWRGRWLTLGAGVVALLAAAAAAALLARRISRPVASLIAFMQRVGDGDLEARADLRGGLEFRRLSAALNRMILDLRDRLHLRNSLQVAMDVQRSLLPAHDPISPLFDVCGRSTYCDETGGDYFDFIDVSPVSASSLLIAVGDVMGHGIPSALVMATARAALRTSVQIDHRLGELMTRTNRVLAADNRHNRFMTLLLMTIDADTRIARWASAGHDPVIVFDPATDVFVELDGGDLPLGIFESSEYREFVSQPLPPGAVLMLGTDGVWEMFNDRKEQYGKQRLRELIRRHSGGAAAEISEALEADLAAFRGVVASADDVTFVVIKLAPPAR